MLCRGDIAINIVAVLALLSPLAADAEECILLPFATYRPTPASGFLQVRGIMKIIGSCEPDNECGVRICNRLAAGTQAESFFFCTAARHRVQANASNIVRPLPSEMRQHDCGMVTRYTVKDIDNIESVHRRFTDTKRLPGFGALAYSLC